MTDREIDAMEAGDELDVLMAEKVMGWHLDSHFGFYNWLDSDNRRQALIADFEPSTDIAAAWQVVEKMFDSDWLTHAAVRKVSGRQQWVVTIQWSAADRTTAIADAFPAALCRAALKCCRNKEA